MRRLGVTFLVSALVSIPAHAADLADGDASLNILESIQAGTLYPFAAPSGDAALRLNGPASTDVLYKYCWYYKTPIGASVRLFSELLAPARAVSGDTLTYTWASNGDGSAGAGGRFDATLTVRLEDGPAPDQARVSSRLVIRNDNPIATTIRFYHLVDLDLPGGTPNPGPDDSLTISAMSPVSARYTESSAPNYAVIEAPGASRFQIGEGLALRNLLRSTTTTDLSNQSGPYAGDGAAAFQWTLTLAPGEQRTIDTAFAINQPVTPPACPADVNGDGSVTVQDVFDFLIAYFSGQPAADINRQDGVTLQDVFDFLVIYFSGCP